MILFKHYIDVIIIRKSTTRSPMFILEVVVSGHYIMYIASIIDTYFIVLF